MASYAPSSVAPQGAVENEIALREPVAEETDASLLSKKDFSHARALIALALFFPTGIFALFYSLKASRQNSRSRGDVEAAYRSAQAAETCTLLSYRIGVASLILLALLLCGVIVFFIALVIDIIHTSRDFG